MSPVLAVFAIVVAFFLFCMLLVWLVANRRSNWDLAGLIAAWVALLTALAYVTLMFAETQHDVPQILVDIVFEFLLLSAFMSVVLLSGRLQSTRGRNGVRTAILTAIGALACAVLLLIAIPILLPNYRDGFHWWHASIEDTMRGYRFYTSHHPSGRFTDTAAERLSALTAEIDSLVVTAANLLTADAGWTDRETARKYYNALKYSQRFEEAAVVNGLVGGILREPQLRLKILFLSVKLGIPKSEARLNQILDEHGDWLMAEDFLNAGSSALYEGGKRWANAHGYRVNQGMGSHRTAWGSF